jgi:hypothetical protein
LLLVRKAPRRREIEKGYALFERSHQQRREIEKGKFKMPFFAFVQDCENGGKFTKWHQISVHLCLEECT